MQNMLYKMLLTCYHAFTCSCYHAFTLYYALLHVIMLLLHVIMLLHV